MSSSCYEALTLWIGDLPHGLTYFHCFVSLMARCPNTVAWVGAFTNELKLTTQPLSLMTPKYTSRDRCSEIFNQRLPDVVQVL